MKIYQKLLNSLIALTVISNTVEVNVFLFLPIEQFFYPEMIKVAELKLPKRLEATLDSYLP